MIWHYLIIIFTLLNFNYYKPHRVYNDVFKHVVLVNDAEWRTCIKKCLY